MGCVLLIVATLAFGLPIKSCDIPPPYAGFSLTNSDQGAAGNEIHIAHRYAMFLDPTLPLTNQAAMTRKKAESIYVLAHELGHIRMGSAGRPVIREAVADRYARQLWCQVVNQLGYFNSCRALWLKLDVTWRRLGLDCRIHYGGCLP